MSSVATTLGAVNRSTFTIDPRRAEIELSVLIPAADEAPNLAILLPWLNRILADLSLSHEVIVITREGDLETIEAASAAGTKVLLQLSTGYGGALIDGLREASGEYVLTLDADLSHRPEFVRDMWSSRHSAEITIASRYVPGGTAVMPKYRLHLSRVLNLLFRRVVSIPVRDLSSGFRLYRRRVLDPDRLTGTDFDVLEEIVVKSFCEGWRVQEIPFDYMPREHGSSSARVVRLGLAYTRAVWRLWKLRNSIRAADYDYRAFESPILLQRYWQRSRLRVARYLTAGHGPVLFVDCGSSRVLESLPARSVALDQVASRLRYDRRFGAPLVQARGGSLPFRDASFNCVLSYDVAKDPLEGSKMIAELCRVLKHGGRLILASPVSVRPEWPSLASLHARLAPSTYANARHLQYTSHQLIDLLADNGFVLEHTHRITWLEQIMAFRRTNDYDQGGVTIAAGQASLAAPMNS